MGIKYKDIAKQLGVSPSTVSMVINNKSGVNEETRNRVLEVLKKSGINTKYPNYPYRGNYIRYINYKKYGKVIDDNGFISSVMDGINIGARDLGYEVLITTINDDNIGTVLEQIKADPRKGIVLLGTELTEDDLIHFKDITVPLVIVDSYIEFEDYDCITMNNIDIVYKVMKYLYDKNYREIGHFQSSFKTTNFLGRREGYKKALKKLKLNYVPENTFLLDPTLDGAYRDMLEILKSGRKLPEAVFADNDTIAVGAIKAIKEFNIKIPEEMAIIGVDDIPFCLMVEPNLTTVAVYKEEIGILASKRLIEKIETGDKSVIKMQVGAEIIERGSTI